ncbi:MAG: hypothetical protein Q4P72_02715 [Eubacteriales bacterium]|nr:hypothetical protein [Eubacteriales bacterium]
MTTFRDDRDVDHNLEQEAEQPPKLWIPPEASSEPLRPLQQVKRRWRDLLTGKDDIDLDLPTEPQARVDVDDIDAVRPSLELEDQPDPLKRRAQRLPTEERVRRLLKIDHRSLERARRDFDLEMVESLRERQNVQLKMRKRRHELVGRLRSMRIDSFAGQIEDELLKSYMKTEERDLSETSDADSSKS